MCIINSSIFVAASKKTIIWRFNWSHLFSAKFVSSTMMIASILFQLKLLISVSLAQLGFVMSVLINLTTSLSEWRRLTRSTITFSPSFAFEDFFFEDFNFDNLYFEDIHFDNVQLDNIYRISPIYFSPSPIYGISKTQIQKKKHMENLKKMNYVKCISSLSYIRI
jgi:hypothetical protein